MKTKTKIWLGIGTVVVASTSAVSAGSAIEASARVDVQSVVGDPTAIALDRVPESSSHARTTQNRRRGW